MIDVDQRDVAQWLDDNRIDTVRTEGINLDGVVIGKYLSRRKFEKALESGVGLSDINAFACDISGAPQFGWWGDWRPEFLGDILQRPDPSTLVIQPGTPGLAACVVDHADVEGTTLPVCSRSIVRQLTERISDLGFEVRMSAELEATAFEESFAEARAKGYRGLTALGGNTSRPGYSITQAHEIDTLLGEIRRRLDTMQIPWEATNKEMAPGQFEINLEPATPVVYADRLMRLKQVVREVALEEGHSVTFMPTPRGGDYPDAYGSGLHVHHSLWRDDEPAFYDASAPDRRSTTMLHWIGGLMSTMDGAVSLLAPTINSYRRMVGLGGGPHVASWCEENKTTAIRTVSRSPSLARIEHRLACSDANPYLLVATILAGGVAGLEEGIDAPDEFRYFAWNVPDHIPHLPSTILDAAGALQADERLSKRLGTELVEYWFNTRRWEWLMFHTSGADPNSVGPTDWELQRYFEVV